MSRIGSVAALCLVVFASCAGPGNDGVEQVAGALTGPTAVPSVVNPSFEDDGTGVASPTGWVSSGSVDADYTEWGGSAGNWRLSHYSANAFSVDTAQTISGFTNSAWYTVRADVRRSAGNNDSYVGLDCGRGQQRVFIPVSWASQWLTVVVSARVKQGSCTITLHTDADGGEWTNFDNIRLEPGAPQLSVLGADVSSLKKSEDLGGVYLDDDHGKCPPKPGDALRILHDHGADLIRLRVWVNPADGHHTIAEAAEMAKRAHQRNLGVLLDLHYSDTWADPGNQTKPAAWASFTTDQLRQAVYDHTYAACTAVTIGNQGPAMVQIGNELNSGMLWPDGKTFDPENFDNLATFLKAGHDAVKACSPDTKVVLHLAKGGDNGTFQWWFDNITQRGVDFDIIAASFYGYWDGGLGDLQANLDDVASRYGKDVMVAETAYPFTLGFNDSFPNAIGLPEQLVPGYPATPADQARYFRDVMSIVRAVPDGHGLGVSYWDATWTAVPGNGWDPTDPTSGNNWENQALFDFADLPLPAMDEYRP
jgi:arabinogalactan endo-1,4-beta-galactosidase